MKFSIIYQLLSLEVLKICIFNSISFFQLVTDLFYHQAAIIHAAEGHGRPRRPLSFGTKSSRTWELRRVKAKFAGCPGWLQVESRAVVNDG